MATSLDLQTDRTFSSAVAPGLRFTLRRISLATRMRFLARNHEVLQQLRFLAAGSDELAERERAVAAELTLSLDLLRCTVVAISGDGAPPHDVALPEWVLEEAPAGLAVEVLRHATAEFSLGEPARKKSLPHSIT
jgi:hypothetical protein